MPRDIDELEICPRCKHDWSAHFAFINENGELVEPYPIPCVECYPPFCLLALEE